MFRLFGDRTRRGTIASPAPTPFTSIGGVKPSLLVKLAHLSIVLVIACVLLLWGEHLAHADAPTDTLTVDASGNLGAPTYRASGFLHPFSPDGTQPPDSLVTPLKPQEIRYTPGTSAPAYPQTCTWGTTPNYGQRIKNLGIRYMELLLSDQTCNPNGLAPGDNGDFSLWQNLCTNMAQWTQQQGIDPQYDIWNEPDISAFWTRSESQWQQTWKVCYQAIRAVNPNAVIIGPTTFGGVNGWFSDFVTFAKNNNVVPNYFTWHNLSNADPVAQAQQAQNVLSAAGVSAQGLIINEWNTGSDPINASPSSQLAWQLARIEHSSLSAAGHTCGSDNTCNSGTLDGALVNGQPSGGWWVFKRYADITGTLLPVTPGSNLDGAAGADANTQQLRVLVGNHGNSGSMQIRLTNLNNTPYVLNNGQTYVTVEDIPTTSGGNLSAPVVVQSGFVPVSNNEADVTINWSNASDAYNIILSPTGPNSSTYQASTNFSSTQGLNGWNYEYSTDGEQSFQNMSWDSGNTRWQGPEQYCQIGGGWQHPGVSCDSVRVWQAPQSGTVTLGANGNLSVAASCGSNPGVNIRILKNGSQLWPSSGWQLLAHGSAYTFPSGVTTTLNAGDQLQFVVAHAGSDNYCDTTAWDQTISYSGSTWTKCADEGGTCSFSGTKQVRYGANGQYYYQTATNSIGCNNSVFGDPIVGTFKACYYQ